MTVSNVLAKVPGVSRGQVFSFIDVDLCSARVKQHQHSSLLNSSNGQKVLLIRNQQLLAVLR